MARNDEPTANLSSSRNSEIDELDIASQEKIPQSMCLPAGFVVRKSLRTFVANRYLAAAIQDQFRKRLDEQRMRHQSCFRIDHAAVPHVRLDVPKGDFRKGAREPS